jgi:hypothetical protein
MDEAVVIADIYIPFHRRERRVVKFVQILLRPFFRTGTSKLLNRPTRLPQSRRGESNPARRIGARCSTVLILTMMVSSTTKVERISAVQIHFIGDGKRFLLTDVEAQIPRLIGEARLVSGCNKSRTRASLDPDRGPNDASRDRIEFVFLFHPWRALGGERVTGTDGTASAEKGWFRARVRGRRSTRRLARFPYRSRCAARCRTCANRDTT